MTTFRAVFSVAVLATSACRTPSSASLVKDDGFSHSWQRILTCDGGAEHIDVDTNARSYLQLVVSNAAIRDHFPANLFGREADDGTQVLLVGQASGGVFDPSQFQVANAYGQDPTTTPWDLTRNGSSIKFRVLKVGLPFPDCETDSFAFPPSCEQSNYVFNGCG